MVRGNNVSIVCLLYRVLPNNLLKLLENNEKRKKNIVVDFRSNELSDCGICFKFFYTEYIENIQSAL